jgi:hypothetical protein
MRNVASYGPLRVIRSCGDLEPEVIPGVVIPDGSELRVYNSTEEGKVVIVISPPDADSEEPESPIDLINGYYNR